MTQSVFLGQHASLVDQALAQLQARRFMQRLVERDPGLWSSDPDVQKTILNRLGWLGIVDVMAADLDAILSNAREIRQAGFTHALLLGMGGSGLFSEVCRYTFGASEGSLQLTVLDSTDPAAVIAAQRQCPPEKLLVIISSKSGGTAEISALSKYFYGQFKSVDKNPGNHCLVITDSGTALEEQAKAWKARKVFTHGPASGSDVGGRFSALTYFGLVPASLMGVDVGKLLGRAQKMSEACRPKAAAKDNPALLLGAVLGAFYAQGRDKMTLLCSPQLSSFGTWVEQLIAESLGKNGKGIAPIFGEDLREPASYGNDHVFVELQVSGKTDPAVDKQAKALIALGHPVVRIQYQDAYDLGGEAVKWSVATAAAGHLMGLNPFDEPNVKESKDRTKALLSAFTARKSLPAEKPLCVDGGISIFGSQMAQTPKSLADAVQIWAGQLHKQDYAVILSFLARTQSLDKQVKGIRQAIADKTNRSTMLGFGPRYLHSTGQLYKGGPDAEAILFLTGDDPEDLAIPGEAYSFSVLKNAQALGDFQALQEKKRRVLRLHLRGNLEAGLKRVLGAVSTIKK